jgi:hypothetical protein
MGKQEIAALQSRRGQAPPKPRWHSGNVAIARCACCR